MRVSAAVASPRAAPPPKTRLDDRSSRTQSGRKRLLWRGSRHLYKPTVDVPLWIATPRRPALPQLGGLNPAHGARPLLATAPREPAGGEHYAPAEPGTCGTCCQRHHRVHASTWLCVCACARPASPSARLECAGCHARGAMYDGYRRTRACVVGRSRGWSRALTVLQKAAVDSQLDVVAQMRRCSAGVHESGAAHTTAHRPSHPQFTRTAGAASVRLQRVFAVEGARSLEPQLTVELGRNVYAAHGALVAS
jgi:hypothetical protein